MTVLKAVCQHMAGADFGLAELMYIVCGRWIRKSIATRLQSVSAGIPERCFRDDARILKPRGTRWLQGMHVRFDNQGRPVRVEDFVSGWLVNNNQTHFGRIVGIKQHTDGSLLVADDANGVIYRIAYTGG
jgi:hypothetical protein